MTKRFELRLSDEAAEKLDSIRRWYGLKSKAAAVEFAISNAWAMQTPGERFADTVTQVERLVGLRDRPIPPMLTTAVAVRERLGYVPACSICGAYDCDHDPDNRELVEE